MRSNSNHTLALLYAMFARTSPVLEYTNHSFTESARPQRRKRVKRAHTRQQGKKEMARRVKQMEAKR